MKIKPSQKQSGIVVELRDRDEQMLAQSGRPAPVPLQLKRILVPIDFSVCSIKALRYALAFARQFEAGLTLLHVVQLQYGSDLFGPADYPALEYDFQAESRKRLAELQQREVGPGISAVSVSRTGRPADEIVDAAKELEMDLIILSTHGYSGIKHVLMGSTAENVVRHAPCPVLIVREHEHEFVTD